MLGGYGVDYQVRWWRRRANLESSGPPCGAPRRGFARFRFEHEFEFLLHSISLYNPYKAEKVILIGPQTYPSLGMKVYGSNVYRRVVSRSASNRYHKSRGFMAAL